MSTTYTLNERLDITLNDILRDPTLDCSMVGYTSLDRKVNVIVKAPELKVPLRGLEEMGAGLYSGTISVDYLTELASREDIKRILAKNVVRDFF